ncbi:VCBS repeat-containing protein [Polaromonas sp. AER18D-145]|uniref:FG-GAP repeat domain-containing protein n=1 Tax=Polaromonas sp. AER18D-145 TaxID=1977060 RepID=UPI001143B281|nr:VCBS repeat-containing protein [Polaromonas sp. AER18D-145]
MTSISPGQPRLPYLLRRGLPLLLASWALAGTSSAMELRVEASSAQCGVHAPAPPAPSAAARQRLPQSQAVQGQKDILWAWLGSPTARYPHAALGSPVHAASLHVLVTGASGASQELVYHLPLHRVFEDRVPRLADLDADGRDEIILVEADALRGAAVVVFGLRASPQPRAARDADSGQALSEVARSPYAGATFRWLNPVGVADFDGDGKPDIASVTTPHVGGVLTLYHFRPPRLEVYARAMDVSNHRMGALEQQLAVTVEQSGSRPTIVVPDMQLAALHALRWDAPGQWTELADPKPLPARVERLTPLAGGGCLLLADASWWRVTLMP